MSLSVLAGGSWKTILPGFPVKVNNGASTRWGKIEQIWALVSGEWRPIFDEARIIDDELAVTYDFSVDRWLQLSILLMSDGISPSGVYVSGSDGDGRTWVGNLVVQGPMTEGIDFSKYVDSIRYRVVKTSNDGSDTVAIQTLYRELTTVLNFQTVGRFRSHLFPLADYTRATIYHDDYAGGAQNAGSMKIYLSAYPKGKNQWDAEGRKSYPAVISVGAQTKYNETDNSISNFHTGDNKLVSTGRPAPDLYSSTGSKANIRVLSSTPTTGRAIKTTITTSSGAQLVIGRDSGQPFYLLADTFVGPGPWNINNWNGQPGQVSIRVWTGTQLVWETITSITNVATTAADIFTIVHSESDVLALGQQNYGRILVFAEYNKVELPLSWFQPATGGSSGGGSGGGCVAANMMMDTQRVASEIQIGDVIDGSCYNPDGLVPRTVRANRKTLQPCRRMVTESGIALIASVSTPMTMRDGSVKMFPDMLGEEVLVDDNGDIRWERVVELVGVPDQEVIVFNVDDQSYFAGEVGNRRIATHNAETEKN